MSYYDIKMFGSLCLIFGIGIGFIIGMKVSLIVDKIRERCNKEESEEV